MFDAKSEYLEKRLLKIPFIFKPATYAMGRLNFIIKFILIILIVSLPLGFLSYALFNEIDKSITTTKKEINALEVVSYTYKLLYWMADYRDYRLLQRINSSDNLSRIVNDKKKLFETSLSTLTQYIKKNDLLTAETQSQLNLIHLRWESLSTSHADVQGSVDDQFLRYNVIIKDLELLVRITSYESTLAHDQNPVNFFLVNLLLNDIPNLTMELGKLRAYGAYALNLTGVNSHTYELINEVYDGLDGAIATAQYGIQQTGEKINLNQDFIESSEAVITKSIELQNYLYENIIESNDNLLAWNDFFEYASSGIEVVDTLSDRILLSLQSNLELRVQEQKNHLYLMLGIAVFLYFIVAYLVLGVYFSIESVLNHYSKKAMLLASGDLTTRLSQQSYDELNTLVVVFNNMAEQLQNNNEKLLEAEKLASMGRMISGVAHEMNTPLGICITSTSFIQGELNKYRSKFENNQLTRDDFINLIQLCSDSSTLVENNLLRCSHLIETFKLLNSFEGISLQKDIVITRLINTCCTDFIEHNPQIEFNLPADNSLVFDTDSNLFSIVLGNIISNAIEHGIGDQKNGVINISLITLENGLELNICDNGSGMDSDAKAKIFDPFYTQHRLSGKTGLGMHIVHIIVTQSLKGSIKIESQLNRGTAVILTLPFRFSDEKI